MKSYFSVAAGFSLRLHRLESLCHHLTAAYYQSLSYVKTTWMASSGCRSRSS